MLARSRTYPSHPTPYTSPPHTKCMYSLLISFLLYNLMMAKLCGRNM